MNMVGQNVAEIIANSAHPDHVYSLELSDLGQHYLLRPINYKTYNFTVYVTHLISLILFLSDNTELNDFRKVICLRKSELSVERISVCNVTENLAEHGIYFLPCSCTSDIKTCYITTMTSC